MTLTIDKKKISGVTIEVDRNGQAHAEEFLQLSRRPDPFGKSEIGSDAIKAGHDFKLG